MANKIQLRRDTTANWNNVNPILADGEPGLDITTNQVKYGDGANAWVDLSYASGGGGSTGAWSAGQTIKTSMLLPDDLGITNDISTSTGNAFVYSYTPVSSSSYLIVETGGMYNINGSGIDAFYSNLFVSSSEIAIGQNSISTAADYNGRYGTFLPLAGRYTNEDTTAKPIYLQFNKALGDDEVTLNYNNGHGWYLKITEIGR